MFANEQPRTVVDFGPDPAESWVRRLVANTIARVQGRTGQAAVVGFDGDPGQTLGGYAATSQSFHGAASRATTNVTTRNDGYPDISTGIVEGPMGEPVRRIFAARLARGRQLP